MFRNYLKTAFRNLLREKSSAAINIAGLTLGITCSLVLFLLVNYMSSFDNFQSKRDRIYRVVHQSEGNNGTDYTSGIPSVLPDAFKLDFPEAEEVVFTSYRSNSTIIIPQPDGTIKPFSAERGTVFTQSNFFKVFDREIVTGDKQHGLDNPNTAIISRRSAKNYFGREDVLGEVVRFDKNEYTITAVMADPPNNTDLPFDLMLSYSTIKKQTEEHGWNSIWSDEHCYFLLKESVSIQTLEARMPDFFTKYLGKDNKGKAAFTIQPFTDIHFDDRYGTYTYDTVSRATLLTFAAIGIILIVTASINFINLATAEAIKRSKEVGIRKSLGSTRGQLIRQFLGETTIVVVISMLLALGAAQLAITYVNPFMEVSLSLDFATNPWLWIFIVGVTVSVALLSGLYPALVVSGYNPVMALKNLVGNKNSSGYALRRGLVITQFVISQFFIFGTIVLIYQMKFMNAKDLGFRKDAVLMVPIPLSEEVGPGSAPSKMLTLRDEMLRVPGVNAASLNGSAPSSGNVNGTNFKMAGTERDYETQVKQVDGNYIPLFDLKLVSGRNLDDLDTANGFVVNEKLCEVVGVTPDDMVGKVIHMWGKDLPVVGVLKNFHTVSLENPIEATILLNRRARYSVLALQIDLTRTQSIIDALKPKWEAAYHESIFEYDFLDSRIQQFYQGYQRMSIMLSVFSGIAIFIGCLGLFGLATFLSNQKTKEIGVRKVMGASVESIVYLFSKEYLKLIGIGFLIAAPIAWFVMGKVLENFEYRINISAWIFAVGFVATIVVALLTVGYRSIRSAVANPATALRSE
ncbi:ABC transporter permease [Chryseolinea sp. T2]|uniref:ABC transporter permease n=1 Tax=Chryseolinea sp. T2 TaxID=3129255 RepID=UPI003076CB3E